jgi:CRISPR system Cascade subunit CasA
VKNVVKPSRNDDPLELVNHPKVAAALVRLGGTEHALHAEIRRQYPDLKLGPAYVNEEGLDRFGLVAGISIPLWNRNRKGIAEAEAARDEARLAAIDAWRALVCDAAEARANLSQLLEHPPVPSSEREHTDRLADAGELTPLEYLAVRDEIMEVELADVDWRRDVALAVAELDRLKTDCK